VVDRNAMVPGIVDGWPSVVIPARDEARHVDAVLASLTGVEELAAIIVVDDGSTDRTARVVQGCMAIDARVRLVCQWPNQGKGAAMWAGAEAAPTDTVLFLDADLIGLTPAHIKALARPVCAGQADMSMALFRHGRLLTDLSHIITPAVSGQRCIRWSRLRDAPGVREARYGVEMVIHQHALAGGWRIERVYWRGVTHPTKEEKIGMVAGFLARLHADAQIAYWYMRALCSRWSRLRRQTTSSSQKASHRR
jgi:polyisoprenyl-phosphate glycosyltransferase